MAKVIVVNSSEGTRIPFLRGILTHSLKEAGLSFEQAYELASKVRDDLAETEEITTRNLRAQVIRRLRRLNKPQITKNYQAKLRAPAPILVRDENGHLTPFSRGRHQQRLECSGLSGEDAFEITRMVYEHLLKERTTEIGSHHLGGLTYGCLKREVGETEAHRYLLWANFIRSGRPLILLIGGTAGCGKSTISTEVTSRLGIVRTQSTDMLREVMRMMIPERLLPVLHASSFNAWQALDNQMSDVIDEKTQLKIGYRRQAELLQVACEAVIQRALREQASVVLEGVHIRPQLLNAIPQEPQAVIVPIMLAVLKKDQLRQRIKGRGTKVVLRRAKRYLRHFDAIWELQDMLLAEADAGGVAIVANEDKEKAVRDVMITIVDKLEVEFSSKPRDVFVNHDTKMTIAKSTKQSDLEHKKPWSWFRSKSG